MTKIQVIAADEDEWLKYTLGLLPRLGHLDVSFHLTTDCEAPHEGYRLFYGIEPPDDSLPFIPHRTSIGDGEMEAIELELTTHECHEVLIYSATLAPAARPQVNRLAFDLLFNVFAYVSCLEESRQEAERGPFHSYAKKDRGESRRFDRPYANYLALALAAFLESNWPGTAKRDLPAARIALSHDVDVIEKGIPVRAKEGLFQVFNALRNMARGRGMRGAWQLGRCVGFVLRSADYFQFERIAAAEDRFGFRSVFYVYGRTARLGTISALRHWIFDPRYDVSAHPALAPALRELVHKGWVVGAHFGFESWREWEWMAKERRTLEEHLGLGPIDCCRQHWFRFSLAETWKAQEQAGIRVDSTMGFTDRPGFRAGIASCYQPFDHESGRALPITVIPTILMDTHLFHYGNQDVHQRLRTIETLLDELVMVGGEAGVIWHSHVFADDHGWAMEYRALLSSAERRGIASLLPPEVGSETPL